MTKPGETLGGRLPLADPATLTSAQRDLFEALKAAWGPFADGAGVQMTTEDGRLIGPFNIFLLHPEVSEAYCLAKPERRGSLDHLAQRIDSMEQLLRGLQTHCRCAPLDECGTAMATPSSQRTR